MRRAVVERGMKLAVLCSADSPCVAFGGALRASSLHEVLHCGPPEAFQDDRRPDAVLLVPPLDTGAVHDLWRAGGWNDTVRWVHSFSAGVDHLDGHWDMLEGGVQLSNGRGAFSSSLGEYILHAALHFNKQTTRCQRNLRENRWERFMMGTLKGARMGFVGFGSIAKSAVPLARAMGMELMALRRDPSKHSAEDGVALSASAMELCSTCDFVVCTLPGTPATKRFFDQTLFSAMRPGTVFISCGRGVCVDEEALAVHLASGRLSAALDVFETEPLPADSPLWKVPEDNLLLTAHNADMTADYFELGWATFLQNLRCVEENKPLCTPVDKEQGY